MGLSLGCIFKKKKKESLGPYSRDSYFLVFSGGIFTKPPGDVNIQPKLNNTISNKLHLRTGFPASMAHGTPKLGP